MAGISDPPQYSQAEEKPAPARANPKWSTLSHSYLVSVLLITVFVMLTEQPPLAKSLFPEIKRPAFQASAHPQHYLKLINKIFAQPA